MVPEGWNTDSVGNLCNFVNGNGFKSSEWTDSGLPIIRIQNLNGSEEFNYYSGTPKPQWLVNRGDILFAWAGTKGVSFGAKLWNGPQGVLNQHIFRVEPKKKLDQHWLYLALLKVTQRVEEKAHGFKATLLHVQKSDITEQVVAVPPLPEQKKIAQILSTWDKAITITEQLLANSQQQKKALMQQLLTGKKRLLDKNGVRFSGEWRFLTFDEAFKVANKKSAQVKSSDYLATGSVPVVDQGKELIAGYCDNDARYTNVPVIIFGDHTRCLKWVDFEFCPGADGTQVLDSKEFLDKKFGYYLLCHTDIPNLGYSRHMRELKEKDFKVPVDMVEQQKIAAVLSSADLEIAALQQKLDAFKQENKALMQQLLTGKRRVKVH